MEHQSQMKTEFVKGDPREWLKQWKKDHPDMHVHQASIDGNRVVIRYSKRLEKGFEAIR